MDVTPTLSGLTRSAHARRLEWAKPGSALEGVAPDLARPIYSELGGVTDPNNHHFWASPRYEQRAVKQAGWKYIHEIRNDAADALYLVQPASQFEIDNLIS